MFGTSKLFPPSEHRVSCGPQVTSLGLPPSPLQKRSAVVKFRMSNKRRQIHLNRRSIPLAKVSCGCSVILLPGCSYSMGSPSRGATLN